jgi:hypothetical protein
MQDAFKVSWKTYMYDLNHPNAPFLCKNTTGIHEQNTVVNSVKSLHSADPVALFQESICFLFNAYAFRFNWKFYI